MKKLSAYTVASNCTDLTDIRDGIAEIHEAMKTCVYARHEHCLTGASPE